MPSVHETAYPRLKSHPPPHELATVYTPTKDEVALAEGAARKGELAAAGIPRLVENLPTARLLYAAPPRASEHRGAYRAHAGLPGGARRTGRL